MCVVLVVSVPSDTVGAAPTAYTYLPLPVDATPMSAPGIGVLYSATAAAVGVQLLVQPPSAACSVAVLYGCTATGDQQVPPLVVT